MKKLFVAVLAVAALASCAQEDVILNNKKAISFGDAYVQNSTKAIYEGTTYVDAFQVWGTVTPNGDTQSVVLYDGANVTRPTGLTGYNPATAWSCDVERFWTPNCEYAFYAVVDATVQGNPAPKNANVTADNGVPTAIKYTADGQNDLLYAATTKNTNNGSADAGLVAFKMQHLLSKITFKVTNPAKNGDYSYNVTSISVSGAYASGTYDIKNGGIWKDQVAGTANLPFAGTTAALASNNAHTPAEAYVIIPGEPVLTITIVTETVFGGKVVSPEQTHTLTVNGTDGKNHIEFAKNTHYNFAVTLPAPGAEIKFTIDTVGGFTGGTPDTTIQ